MHSGHSGRKKYILLGRRGKVLIKLYSDKDSLPQFIEFLRYLSDKKTTSQKCLYWDNSKQNIFNSPYAAFQFEEGSTKEYFKYADIKDVSEILANMHIASIEYLVHERNIDIKNGFGIIHGDVNLDNIIFTPHGPKLIDFDNMKIRPLMRDLSEFVFYLGLIDLTRIDCSIDVDATKTKIILAMTSYSAMRPLYNEEYAIFSDCFFTKINGFRIYSTEQFNEGIIDLYRLKRRLKAFKILEKLKLDTS